MPSINNVGGSLTSAIILTLLAWGVRVLRATAQRQGTNNQRRGSKSDLQASLGRFFAALSPAALRMLVRKPLSCRLIFFCVARCHTTSRVFAHKLASPLGNLEPSDHLEPSTLTRCDLGPAHETVCSQHKVICQTPVVNSICYDPWS
jgi:hypothetical protein